MMRNRIRSWKSWKRCWPGAAAEHRTIHESRLAVLMNGPRSSFSTALGSPKRNPHSIW